MSATIDTWTGRLGLLAGVLVVAAWLAVTGTPGGAAEPPATVRLGVLVNGELDISPLKRPVLQSSKLRAGGRALGGTLTLRNQTPRTRSFAIRTQAVQQDLDRAARIEVSDGNVSLLQSSLGQSRDWTEKNLRLASGETRELGVRVWIPKGSDEGWQAARADLTLEFSSTPERAR